MNNNKSNLLSEQINQGVQKAIKKAIERHRKLGESIAISKNGKVIIRAKKTHIILRRNKYGVT